MKLSFETPRQAKAIKDGYLLLVPSGGLANRMMAIASAYAITKQNNCDLKVVWFQDWALEAPFHSIFTPPGEVRIDEAKGLDFLVYDRARRKNLWIPALPQKMLFERRIRETEIYKLKLKGFDFSAWMQGHKCYMSCHSLFGNVPDTLFRDLFHPVPEVMDVVSEYRSRFSTHTIGLHIRRTDHVYAISNSPDELFIKKVEQEIEAHGDTTVFLATDNNQVKKTFADRFGKRIITPTEEAARNSIDGIRGGLVDMYTLAATDKIYGSAGSTFSPMAASLGGNDLEILQREKV